jgi:hypothetical protein
MQKWEYLEVTIRYTEVVVQVHPSKGQSFTSDESVEARNTTKYLDSLGAKGWELVNVLKRHDEGALWHYYFFKRPIE